MSSILIFDSGIGGLSILEHIHQLPNQLDIHYVADYAAYPYGEKEESWLIQRINQLISQLANEIKPDIIIIACNTASTLALPSLRKQLAIPIVGVVPAIKTASTLSQNNKIGLLATPGTIARTYMDHLIQEFANNCIVTRVGSTELVNLAEEKLNGNTTSSTQLRSILQPFIDNNCDHVVLGCTHFPLLKEELNALNTGIQFIDSGEAIANRTRHILSECHSKQSNNASTFYSTKPIGHSLKKHLINTNFTQFKSI